MIDSPQETRPAADSTIQSALQGLLSWVESNPWKGYDPYDALKSPLVAYLDRSWHFGGRLAIQFLKLSPLNLRPLIGIPRVYDAKALGLAARAFWLLDKQNSFVGGRKKATECLRILEDLRIAGFSGSAWAHDFPYRSSRLYLAAGTPSVVSTVYAAQAFLDGYETLQEQRWLEIARSACDFILKDLDRIGTPKRFCFSYLPYERLAIHNASLLAAQLLARVSWWTGDDWSSIITAAVEYTVADQCPGGYWYYDGVDSPMRSATFVDGFHTGFVLENLWEIASYTGLDLEKPLHSGLDFYITRLFDPDGKPKRTVEKSWPVDLRDCAQAIILLAKLAKWDDRSMPLLEQVVAWTLSKMQSPKGYFYFTRNRWFASPVSFFRFQAWMLCALATVAYCLDTPPQG